MTLSFIVPGEAVPAARPRFSGSAGSPVVYTPERYSDWLTIVAVKAHEGRHHSRTLEGPVSMSVIIYRKSPIRMKKADSALIDTDDARRPRPIRGTGDIDNLVKGIMDGCTRAHVWHDDRQVSRGVRSSGCASHVSDSGASLRACAVRRRDCQGDHLSGRTRASRAICIQIQKME